MSADFRHPDGDRVISFTTDQDGMVSFFVLQLVAPLELDGLEQPRWRKVFQSPLLPSNDAAFAAARTQFAWVQPTWREHL